MQVYVLDEERKTLLSNNEFCLPPVGRFFFFEKIIHGCHTKEKLRTVVMMKKKTE
jgi:hypothetical protein